MVKTFHVSIVTPELILFEGDIAYLFVPGGAGSMGILPDHAGLLSSLVPGAFELRLPITADNPQSKSISFITQKSGFIEVSKNVVSILLDAADSYTITAQQIT